MAMKIVAVAVLAAAFLLLAARDASSQPTASDPSAVPGEVLFRFRPDNSPGLHPKIEPVTSHLGFFANMEEIHYNHYLDTWRVKVPGLSDMASTIDTLRADPTVEFAQPNYRYTNAGAPDDPLYHETQQPYYGAINAVAAWGAEPGSFDIVAAVVDGGVDTDHPELVDRIWTNPGDPADGLDNDGNGCVDDTHGCSFQSLTPDGDVADLDGHGTFVAGIIGARRDNGEGVAGVAERVTIMPVRTLNSSGVGTTEQLAASILYASRNGADVINLSLTFQPVGGSCSPESEDPDQLVEAALGEAHDLHGSTIVAAAGNFGLPCVGYPASSPYSIAVGASGPPEDADVRGVFSDDRSSHWGPEIDIAAPGVDIASSCPVPTVVPTGFCPGGPYSVSRGTSFAAPIVTGAAVLLLAQDPERTNEGVRERLRATALDLPDEQTPNWDGAGRLDLGAALGAGSGFAVIDVASPDSSLLDLAIVVGDATAPLCRAALWVRPEVHASGIQGSFGVGECADFWPPDANQPWSLYGDTDNRKAADVNGWSLRMADTACTVAARAPVPRAPAVISENACNATAVVPNDQASAAINVELANVPFAFEQQVRYAMATGDPIPSCVNRSSRGVWYRLRPSGHPAGVVVDTSGSEYFTVVALYSANFEELACNFESLADRSRITWRTDGISDYYIQAAALQSVPAGRLKVHVTQADIPSNDLRQGAFSVSPSDPFPIVEPAHTATSESSDPAFSCKPSYGSSLWFRVSPSAGLDLLATTLGSTYNTVLAVFKEEGSALTEVACNDDEVPGGKTSAAAWQADGGDYLIVVGTFPGHPGNVLHLQVVPH